MGVHDIFGHLHLMTDGFAGFLCLLRCLRVDALLAPRQGLKTLHKEYVGSFGPRLSNFPFHLASCRTFSAGSISTKQNIKSKLLIRASSRSKL